MEIRVQSEPFDPGNETNRFTTGAAGAGAVVTFSGVVRDEGGVIVPMYADYLAAATKKVKFENPAGNWPLDGHKNAERWWFA